MNAYTLHHGDCLDILPTLAPGSVDAVITDPPYGTTACKWDSVIPFDPMWEQIRRVLKPRGACVLFGSQPFTSALVMSNPGWYRHEWVWRKNKGSNFANTVREPFKEHENILIFSADNWTYNPQMQKRNAGGLSRVKYQYSAASIPNPQVYNRFDKVRSYTGELRHPSSVQSFDTQTGLHPTQKPLALLEYLVRTYTNEGDTVLDFAFGSGTTGAACGNLDRAFVGIEKDAEYFRLGSERIATAYAPLRAMQAAAQ